MSPGANPHKLPPHVPISLPTQDGNHLSRIHSPYFHNTPSPEKYYVDIPKFPHKDTGRRDETREDGPFNAGQGHSPSIGVGPNSRFCRLVWFAITLFQPRFGFSAGQFRGDESGEVCFVLASVCVSNITERVVRTEARRGDIGG
jgi:hypothetical protein